MYKIMVLYIERMVSCTKLFKITFRHCVKGEWGAPISLDTISAESIIHQLGLHLPLVCIPFGSQRNPFFWRVL